MVNKKISYKILDNCSYDELFLFMKSVDGDFIPSLFQRINIEHYINKLLENASIHTCRYNGEIIGMVAFYDNNLTSGEAYISYLAVDALWRKMNIASELLNKVCLTTRERMKCINVSTCNDNVVSFYERNGYIKYKEEYDLVAEMCRFYLSKKI